MKGDDDLKRIPVVFWPHHFRGGAGHPQDTTSSNAKLFLPTDEPVDLEQLSIES
jgi:hypothetical protein